MQISFFNQNLTNPATLIPQIKKEWKSYFELKAFNEYYPKNHKVNKKNIRRDKWVKIPDPLSNLQEPTLVDVMQPVNRISGPWQKIITNRSTAFATGGGCTLTAKPEGTAEKALFIMLQDTWRRNKMEFKNPDIVRTVYSETECAEIWYSEKTDDQQDFEMKCNIFKASDGYDLIPVFDPHRDLIGFGLGYKGEELNVKYEYLDVYSDKAIHKYIKGNGSDWTLRPQKAATDTDKAFVNPQPLPYGKIPVIYFNTMTSIWNDVQPMIDRLETILSNLADSNDYNSSPTLFAKGRINGLSAKGEQGKFIEGDKETDLKYVGWDQAPAAIKLEVEFLIDFIFTGTQTPNISLKEMISLGNVSGVAYDRIMIDAHLKAKDIHIGWYGEGVQRRINLLAQIFGTIKKDAIGGQTISITPTFNLFKIDDLADRIANATKAYAAGLITILQAVDMIGITDDPEQTVKDLLAAKAQAEADKQAEIDARKVPQL